ncbi:MAG: nucleotide exchange factor GrpE, partial [Clostridia bacterium]|nr:nucleotide exchange factor GrpE [Clostridia bacterium]
KDKKLKEQEAAENTPKTNSEEEIFEEGVDVDKLSEKRAKILLKQYAKDYDELKKQNEELSKKVEETNNDYLRARADCENVRKHTAEAVKNAYDDGKLEAAGKILSIGDSLDWALKMPLDDKTREGIEKLVKKYHEALESLGVKEFSPEAGSVFDPNTAAAVMQADGEEGEESGTIKQVFGRGYKLGDKVIRYAQVSVVR